ncbi:MAG: RIP metalloprotease RseP [Clostridiales bacterium]|nr:RIP metalloprotease RseP [Clostridiales bacterium]
MRFVIAFLVFSIVVLFHELGHFLLAKANGVRVNEFSFGLGPTLVGVKKGETKYSIKLLPFGGACMMEGEDEDSDDERAFGKKPVWGRISIVFAGPFFNFLLAFVMSLFIIACIGYDAPVIADVIEGYPAEAAGMQAGDEIVRMGSMNIHFYREVSAYGLFHPGQTVEITYKRDGEKYTASVTPEYSEENEGYLYGFMYSSVRVKGSVFKTVENAFFEVKYWIWSTVQSLRMLVTGQLSLNDMSGPVGIVKSIGDTYKESVTTDGYFYAFLNMLNWGILLSANLGVMNLLPLPALDGGRLVFLIIEAIRRKRVDPDKEGMVHFVGIVVLLLLMVVIMFNDIRQIIVK